MDPEEGSGLEAVEVDVLVEKGFAEDNWDEGFAPKRVSPILIAGFDGCLLLRCCFGQSALLVLGGDL